MAPVFETIEDLPDCVNDIVKDNNLPGRTLRVERGWGVEELELLLEGRLARLRLAEKQELRGRCAKPVSRDVLRGEGRVVGCSP